MCGCCCPGGGSDAAVYPCFCLGAPGQARARATRACPVRALQSLLRPRKQRDFPSGLFTNGLVRRVDSETTHASHSDRR